MTPLPDLRDLLPDPNAPDAVDEVPVDAPDDFNMPVLLDLRAEDFDLPPLEDPVWFPADYLPRLILPPVEPG